ncbi:23808_t:CDS:2 [Entrophospora sp. SA101]|nr:14570_t:CDS:2 [Entrophospora sp. SA101]CAJ0748397.1 23808_t:CDS:2 [Entrophospora sp. SA101]CAJ0883443.1 4081_t:CDS:2 [Entrophospora sp. SA101]CAJ0883499.1 4086_t:CDS:2 [Entrophospora sp. SA101]
MNQTSSQSSSSTSPPLASTKLSSIETGICGAVAGMVSRFVSSPLDVVKIRLQVKIDNQNQSLWKGNLSAEFLYLSYGSIQFLTYQKIHNLFLNYEKNNSSSLSVLLSNKTLQSFIAGGICGSTATFLTYPFDILRTRFAAQGETKLYNGIMDAIRQIHSQEGFKGFYKGLTASIMQIIPYMGLMFGSFELFKKTFEQFEEKNQYLKMFSSTNDMIIGAMSGIISKTGVFPLDLIRKRMQLQIPPSPKQKYFFINYIPLYTNSIIVNIKTIIRNEGFCGLYRGLTPAIIKAAPVSAVTFFAYNKTREVLEKLH